jgi:hypothetical protein
MMNLDTLRALADAATPGRRITEHRGDGLPVVRLADDITHLAVYQRTKDAAFAAAADPQTVIGLLDELARLRAAIQRLREMCEDAEPHATCHCSGCAFVVAARAALEEGSDG